MKSKLYFKATREQRNALEGLAYWIANENYIRERYGNNDPEIDKCKKTICNCIFPECDDLAIPFWVQNSIICWAENWRQYKEFYLREAMEEKNIIL